MGKPSMNSVVRSDNWLKNMLNILERFEKEASSAEQYEISATLECAKSAVTRVLNDRAAAPAEVPKK